MLSFVVRRRPPRTRVAHLNRIYFDDGRSSIEFKSPSDRYLVINYWPPAAADEDVSSGRVPTKANCALAPGLHWHRHQDETFHILEGTAKFIFKGEESLAIPGNVVVIPKREFHTFCNASETHEMSVELVLEPGERERDEEFFRNMQTYRDDCRKANMARSLPQLLLFMARGGVVMAMPGPAYLARPLGLLLNLLGGVVVGKWFLGYSDTYSEYYHPK